MNKIRIEIKGWTKERFIGILTGIGAELVSFTGGVVIFKIRSGIALKVLSLVSTFTGAVAGYTVQKKLENKKKSKETIEYDDYVMIFEL